VVDELHAAALRMLARRALSVAELAERLERRDYQDSEVRAEVRRLIAAGLLRETALARAICSAQLTSGHGRRAIAIALRRRKIDGDAAAGALASVDEEAEQAALAHALAKAVRKHPHWRTLPDERRKVLRYLLTRGFAISEARRALREHGGYDHNAGETIVAGDPPEFP